MFFFVVINVFCVLFKVVCGCLFVGLCCGCIWVIGFCICVCCCKFFGGGWELFFWFVVSVVCGFKVCLGSNFLNCMVVIFWDDDEWCMVFLWCNKVVLCFFLVFGIFFIFVVVIWLSDLSGLLLGWFVILFIWFWIIVFELWLWMEVCLRKVDWDFCICFEGMIDIWFLFVEFISGFLIWFKIFLRCVVLKVIEDVGGFEVVLRGDCFWMKE